MSGEKQFDINELKIIKIIALTAITPIYSTCTVLIFYQFFNIKFASSHF